MDRMIEEYGFILVAAICAFVLSAAFMVGLEHDGFIGQTIIEQVKSIIGG